MDLPKHENCSVTSIGNYVGIYMNIVNYSFMQYQVLNHKIEILILFHLL